LVRYREAKAVEKRSNFVDF